MAEETEKQEEKIDAKKIWRRAIWISIGVWIVGFAITRVIGVCLFSCNEGDNSVSAGLFGDSFGAVNALISALAFAGVIVTFWLQRKELDLQRNELNLQYQELKAQRVEFTQQNKTLKLQRFENTFFHMMELQQQIVNDLYIKLSDRVNTVQRSNEGRQKNEVIVDNSVRGRQVIKFIYERYVENVIQTEGLQGYANVLYRDLLDHYFRHLYTILRYVDETDAFSIEEEVKNDKDFEWKQKYHYTTIVRATLSRYESLMLYYNGLSEFGRDKLKPLIEKYAILNNIDKYSLSFSAEYQNSLGTEVQLYSNRDWNQRYGLTGKDYEYYLTEASNDPSKYYIKAFGYKEDEIASAKQSVLNYNRMMKEFGKKVIDGGTIVL